MTNQASDLAASIRLQWPDVRLYANQRRAMQSLVECVETVITAGNQLGKDYMAGLAAISFFLWPQFFFPKEYVSQVESRRKEGQPDWLVHTRRVVTTSVNERHLAVLWGEIGRFITTCKTPLLERDDGPLVVNFREVRFKEDLEGINYIKGLVSQKGEGMAGHHAAYNLCIIDEASGAENQVYEFAQGWAKRFLIFGNPNNCENFFRKMVRGGDVVVEGM